MALNALELKILSHLIATHGRRPRVLFLGYPDLLCSAENLSQVGVEVGWSTLPKRADSSAAWQTHGRQLESPMLETAGFFRALGATPFVVDAIEWGGENFIVDLNVPLSPDDRARLGSFDLVVDPGTIEHCFNIAQAFENVVTLLADGGVVFHQAAIAFPNHGFWSISPTAFYDFYENQGFELGTAYVSNGTLDPLGFVPRLKRLSCFGTGEIRHVPAIGLFVFRKKGGMTPNTRYPVQRCYSALRRDITTIDFIRDALLDRPEFAALALTN